MAATKLSQYNAALRHLGDIRLATITDDVEARYILDDAWETATTFVLRQAAWRFALKQSLLTASGSAITGYTFQFPYPADWLRTHAVFLYSATGNRECPVDFRERGSAALSVNVTNPVYMRYVSNTFLDPALASNPWPEHFAQVHAVYLAFSVAERVTGSTRAATEMSQLFASLLPEAVAVDAVDEDPWLPHQRSGVFLRAAREMVDEGLWRFALKTVFNFNTANVGEGGLAYRTAVPADWAQTRSLYQLSADGQRRPFDARERSGGWLHNTGSGFYSEYVATTLAMDSTLWPGVYMRAVLRKLQFDAGGEKAEQLAAAWKDALQAALSVEAESPDPWLEHQFSGAFLRVARATLDEGFWRFATPTPILVTTAAGGGGGHTRNAPIPADWTASRSLYRLTSDNKQRPIDIRERDGFWLTSEADFYAEYISTTLGMNPLLWPDQYARAVLRQLEFDKENLSDGKDQQADGAAWQQALQSALDGEANPPDPWLPHQLSGTFARCFPAVISKGYWKFARSSRSYNAETDQDAVPTDGSYPYRFTIPADWFKTAAIFVPWDGAEVPIDVREREGRWYTATANFTVHYISAAALVPTNWPDSLAKAVLAYLDLETVPEAGKKNAAALYAEALNAARTEWSLPEDKWLHFQLDGRFWEAVKFVLAAGRWRGAVKTVVLRANATLNSDGTINGTLVPTGLGDGSISPSYSAVFIKPADWYRTINMYRVIADPSVNFGTVVRDDIDYRDEGGAFHTNWDTIQVRYLSRDGLAGVRSPPSFRNAVLAWLLYEESGYEQKRLSAYQDILSRAEEEDDNRERQQVNQVGRFVRARYGNRWMRDNSRSGAVSTETVLTDDSGTVILTP